LNLTHGEPPEQFLRRYGEATKYLRPAIEKFSPAAVRAWCEALGQPTFVGSSGRVFPQSMKASPLLRAWLARLRASGVVFELRHRWSGWDEEGRLVFDTPGGAVKLRADAIVLALGGASWPKLGSDGDWQGFLRATGIDVAPLVPANCGFIAGWSEVFGERHQGQPLKSIELRFGEWRVRGEAIVTRAGLEGGAIYALSGLLRDAIAARRYCTSICGPIRHWKSSCCNFLPRAASSPSRRSYERRRACRRRPLGFFRKRHCQRSR
jgi:uncharacterized flavoprotein (TIGR03862 family)